MRIRRLMLVLPLVLLIGACFSPTGPRLPDEDDGGDDPPPTTDMVVDRAGSGY